MCLIFYTIDPCKKEYSPYGGFCFHIYAREAFPRNVAQHYCHSIGGNLINIDNYKKWLALFQWILKGKFMYHNNK